MDLNLFLQCQFYSNGIRTPISQKGGFPEWRAAKKSLIAFWADNGFDVLRLAYFYARSNID